MPFRIFGLSVNFIDLYFGELLTVTVETTITFATFLLENDHFVTLHEGLEHFTLHCGSFNGRSTDFYVVVGIKTKYLLKCDLVTCLYLFAEMVNIQKFAFFGFELLSFDFYNSVHYKNTSRKREPLASLHMKSQAF